MKRAYTLTESIVYRWLRGMIFGILFAGCFAGSISAQDLPRFEIAAGYTYVRSNAPPGACRCFAMNGGTLSAGINLISGLNAVADVTVVHTGDVDASNQAFTLTSYTFGPRFTLHAGEHLNPFVEGLAGGVHASGLGYGTAAQSASALAAMAGGGLDLVVNRRFAVRLVEADYYFTHLPNGVNSNESNLRLSFGVVFRFGHQ